MSEPLNISNVSSTPMPELTAGKVIGKYRIERVLGEGAMGVVVEATNLDLDERVALKFMRESSLSGDEALERFAREARAAAKLKSEHVARVFDVASFGSAPFIVMEYLEGRDLEALIAQSGPLPVSTAVLYIIQACEALAEAHARGIVHRDIKPANIFIVERGGFQVAKVLDFGVSKIAQRSDAARPSLKDTCGLVGSPFYMAPERFRATPEALPTCDTWSLGVVLYEALTGRMPFEERGGLMALMQAVTTCPHPRMTSLRSDLPEALVRIVDWCLEKDPARRCPSAADLATSLLPFAPSAARLPAERALAMATSSGQRSERGSIPPSAPPPPVTLDRRMTTASSASAPGAPALAPNASLGKGFGLAVAGVMTLTCLGVSLERGRHPRRSPPRVELVAASEAETRVTPIEPEVIVPAATADVAPTVSTAATARSEARPSTPSRRARAHSGASPAAAPLDTRAINAVVRTHAAELQACVDTAQSSGDVHGKLAVRMSLDASGAVVDAAVAESTAKSRALEGCILHAVRAWTLPTPPSSTPMSVTYTFVFK